MKSSDLRIGNIVSVCYENQIVPDKVIVLEPDVVHLSQRQYPDNEHDIIGVPLDEQWLMHFFFRYEENLKVWQNKDIKISKINSEYWSVQCGSLILKIKFVHHLQDVLHLLAIRDSLH